MSREFWDFNETENYTSIACYKVLNRWYNEYTVLDTYDAARLLYEIDIFVHRKLNNLKKIIHNFDINIKNKLLLLLNTPYSFQEMQLNTGFIGLNKPKNVIEIKNVPIIGKDGKLRAKRRLIFLQLRYANGNIKSLNELKPLVIHEIAHTACNHVQWRDDDHGEDFKTCENIIKML